MEEKRYLKWYNKVGYGSGDIAGNVVYALLAAFVMIFLTDTVGLNAGIVGTLIAVSKLFDGDNKPLHKKNYFINSFIKDFDLPQQKKYLYKHFFKYIKVIESSLREALPQKISLKEILEIREKTFLLWHNMEKDLWPLPQILQEDYNIKTLSSNVNIIEALLTKNKNIINSLNEFIF